MKKLINLLLVAALAIAMLAGGVSAVAEEGVTTTSIGTYTVDNPYHLIFEYCEMYNESDPTARAAVVQAINDYMIPNYQIEVEFLPLSVADYYANTPLMLSSGEPLDVLPIMFKTAGSWIDMGGVLDLTPYMDSEEGQKIIDALGSEEVAYSATRMEWPWEYSSLASMAVTRASAVCSNSRSDCSFCFVRCSALSCWN